MYATVCFGNNAWEFISIEYSSYLGPPYQSIDNYVICFLLSISAWVNFSVDLSVRLCVCIYVSPVKNFPYSILGFCELILCCVVANQKYPKWLKPEEARSSSLLTSFHCFNRILDILIDMGLGMKWKPMILELFEALKFMAVVLPWGVV